MSTPRLELRGISKRFGGVRALSGVNLHAGEGEVLALLGENGAGKSTLMKILAGVQRADEGEVRIDGKPIHFHSVSDAQHHGVALIHQELNLASNLDVAGNVFLGREPLRAGLLDQSSMRRNAEAYLKQAGLDVDPASPLDGLTIGKRQQVEIAKALAVDARILIMDEPTSSLSLAETEKLFEVILSLRARGVTIIYISHRLGEIVEIADRVEVLRDGENAGSLQRDEISHDAMIRLMVGRDLDEFFPRHEHAGDELLLEVSGLRTQTYPEHEVSFSLKGGEIVGVAGLVGAGRTEVLRSIFGVDKRIAGSVSVAGKEVPNASIREAIASGLALVPEDRKAEGLILEMDVPVNLGITRAWYDRVLGFFLSHKSEKAITEEMRSAMNIKASSEQKVSMLSGGNQQKVALGKWLAMKPGVLLLDEPTRGVDVGAKREIYTLMEDMANQGKAVLFVSSDLPEVLGMADRIIVMHEGQITGELSAADASEESVMALATGHATTKEEALQS